MDQYISVRRFAELAGVSRQTVSKQTRTRLREYAAEIHGQKMIDVAALEKFYGIEYQPGETEDSQPCQPKATDNQPLETQNSQPSQPDQPEGSQLSKPKETEDSQPESTEIIKFLKDQIQDLNDEIHFLQNQVERKDRQIENLSELLRNEQQLSAVNQKRLLELEAQPEVVTVTQPEEKQMASGEGREPSRGIMGFFKRLFG